MGLLRYQIQELCQDQRTTNNVPPTTTRFVRFQRNMTLYSDFIANNNRQTRQSFRPEVVSNIYRQCQQADPSDVAAEDRDLLRAISCMWLTDHVSETFLAILARQSAQSVIFEVLVKLLDEGVISRSALEDCVDLTTSTDVWRVFCTFMLCFELGSYLHYCPREIFMTQMYPMPILWLACMVVRGAKVDLDIIVGYIGVKKFFGALDMRKFWRLWPDGVNFKVNPKALVSDKEKTGYIGMGLSMGVVEADVVSAVHHEFDDFDERLASMEKLCREYFGFSEEELVPVGRSMEQLDLLRRYNANEGGLVWDDGYIYRA